MSHRLGRDLSQLLLLGVLAALSGSCSSVEKSTDVAGTGGSGSTYQPPTCDQGCQDYLVGWALDDTMWFLWNQKVVGHPVGVQDIAGACPLGGTVHVTGTDTLADGTTTTDVQFALDHCENSGHHYDLTFTGTVSMEGSFDSATNFTAEVFSAPALDISGSLSWLDNPAIDESGNVTVKQQGEGDAAALSGRVGGRDFDEASLYAGSGGSSSSTQGGSANATAGTSSGSCACFCPDNSDCTGAKTANPCGVDAQGIPEPCACPVGCP